MHHCPYSPFDPAVIAQPFAYYAWLRQYAPVYAVPRAGYFAISRYQDIKHICKQPDIFSSRFTGFLREDDSGQVRIMDVDAGETAAAMVLGVADPPEHTRHRRLLSKCFAPRVRQLEAWLGAHCTQLLEQSVARGGMDFMAEYASVIPSHALCHLLGLPLADAAKLERWSALSAQVIGGVSTDEDLLQNGMEILQFREYITDKFARAQRTPGDNVLGDLACALRMPSTELCADEVVGMLFQLIVGGHETTAATIGSAIHMAQQFPAVYAALAQTPALAADYVEEVLRLETPAQGNYRKTTTEITVAGTTIPKESTLMLMWASANRDEQVFAHADQLILHRHNIKHHLGFGQGIHFCVGAALARMEARVALQHFLLLTRQLRVTLSDAPAVYLPSLFIRRLAKLDIQFC